MTTGPAYQKILGISMGAVLVACGGGDNDAGMEGSRHAVWLLTAEPCSIFRTSAVDISLSREQKLGLMFEAATQADAALEALSEHTGRYGSDRSATDHVWNISSMGGAHDALAENRATDYSKFAQSALYGCSEADRVLRNGGS